MKRSINNNSLTDMPGNRYAPLAIQLNTNPSSAGNTTAPALTSPAEKPSLLPQQVDTSFSMATCPAWQAIRQGDLRSVQALMTGSSADMSAAVVLAIKERRHDILAFLMTRGIDPDATDAMGRTPLMHAVLAANSHAVRLLLANGASPNMADSTGNTALTWAIRENRAKQVLLLLQGTVDLDQKEGSGQTAIELAVALGHVSIAKACVARKQEILGMALPLTYFLVCCGRLDLARFFIRNDPDFEHPKIRLGGRLRAECHQMSTAELQEFAAYIAISPEEVQVLWIGWSANKNDQARMLVEALNSNKIITSFGIDNDVTNAADVQIFAEVLKNNATLTNLDLSENHICPDGVRHLAEALKCNSTLTTLDLAGNHMGPDDVRHLAEALKSNSTLTELRLSSNDIGPDGVRHLAETLKSNSTLSKLDISANDIGPDGVRYFSDVLKCNQTVTVLDLGDMQMEADYIQYLSDALKSNHSLTKLILWNGSIDADSARYLSDTLKNNHTLTTLDLGSNDIDAEGARYLSSALNINHALTTLNLNDDCYEGDQPIEGQQRLTIKAQLEQNRALPDQKLGAEAALEMNLRLAQYGNLKLPSDLNDILPLLVDHLSHVIDAQESPTGRQTIVKLHQSIGLS